MQHAFEDCGTEACGNGRAGTDARVERVRAVGSCCRPWKSYAQFDRKIGKYVGVEKTAQLAQYTFIPIRLNNGSDADS
jgi:hypothetical protein